MQTKKLYQPPADSHKGQNGKLLVIGGSKLFHSSVFWSADVASRIVDLVHFSSPANENNILVRKKLKENLLCSLPVSDSTIIDRSRIKSGMTGNVYVSA